MKKFKSYYVVWKPYEGEEYILKENEFKSYYVVWKHCRRHACGRKISRFKSYYVVWKLLFVLYVVVMFYRLNRTM